jgi:peroxiredoxin (alkyl hydroperoxide reductase subunit C)
MLFPRRAGKDQVAVDLYGMIHSEVDSKLTIRTVFVIDPTEKQVW